MSLERLLNEPGKNDPYFVYPFLPRNARMIIGGQTKAYKSFLALNLAYDIANGDDLFGIWKVKEPFTVLVVEQEIGPYRLKERLQTIHSYKFGKIAPYNLFVATKDLDIKLDNPSGLVKLAGHIEECKPQIVLLDPLRKLHRRKEDDSTEMVTVFDNLDWLEKKYDLSIILVHHTGKSSEFRDPRDAQALRGSSEISADADTIIMIEQPVRNDRTILRLNFTLRSAQEPPPLMLQFNKNTLTFSRIEGG